MKRRTKISLYSLAFAIGFLIGMVLLINTIFENDMKRSPRWTSGVIEKFDPERNIMIFVHAENFNYEDRCYRCSEWKVVNPEQLESQEDCKNIEIQYVSLGIFRCDCNDKKVVPIVRILRTREKI